MSAVKTSVHDFARLTNISFEGTKLRDPEAFFLFLYFELEDEEIYRGSINMGVSFAQTPDQVYGKETCVDMEDSLTADTVPEFKLSSLQLIREGMECAFCTKAAGIMAAKTEVSITEASGDPKRPVFEIYLDMGEFKTRAKIPRKIAKLFLQASGK